LLLSTKHDPAAAVLPIASRCPAHSIAQSNALALHIAMPVPKEWLEEHLLLKQDGMPAGSGKGAELAAAFTGQRCRQKHPQCIQQE